MVRLDELMPSWDVHQVHATAVRASAHRVDRALREVRADEIRLFGLLMTLRGMRAPHAPALRPLLQTAQEGGFALLADDPEHEVVLGVIGRFWRLRDRSIRAIGSPSDFTAFAEPGFARAAMNFRIEPLAEGACRLSTETRISGTDAAARRAFRLYWTIIRPGSALIRRTWLAAVKRRAEGEAPR